MAAVDEVREAVERTVPHFSGRTGDWAAVLEKARPDGRVYLSRRKWSVAATAAVAAAAAVVLFWPDSGGRVDVLGRARAAMGRGPVTHVVVHRPPIEVYDLERHEYRSVPNVLEEWFDPARGFHGVERTGSRVFHEFRGRGLAHLPEGDVEFAGIATAYRHALATDRASLGPEKMVQGRRVYWIGFKQYEVAVDAETFEPRFVRFDDGPVLGLVFETLGVGEGDFAVARRGEDGESSSWSGPSRIGALSPEEAREALRNALWLGKRFGEFPLSSIREVSWTTVHLQAPPEVHRALELCYGQGERCAVSMTEATGPGAAGGQARVIAASRETLGLALADKPGGLGYVFRDGVWVTVQARGRDELIAAAEALARIP